MAKLEQRLTGNFDSILRKIEDGILSGSVSADLEDSSDFRGENARASAPALCGADKAVLRFSMRSGGGH